MLDSNDLTTKPADISEKNYFGPDRQYLLLDEEEKHVLSKELEEIESDMNMLKETLSSKNRRANEIRRQLGMTQFDIFMNTFNDGLIKTTHALSTAKDKTLEFASSVKNSEAYKNAGAKMDNLITQVKILQTIHTGHFMKKLKLK